MKTEENFIDENGRIKAWPSKRILKYQVLKYLSERFELNRTYTEKEVNKIIDENHTFGDYFLLRRELIESRLMGRTRNGSQYWREKEEK